MNCTGAKVSVKPPVFDYVDNNDQDVDSIVDKGMHSNFPAERVDSDSTYDMLSEENTEGIEDYVDGTSNIDASSDVGTHSNFENQKSYDSIYDTLTEQNTELEQITKAGIDTGGTGTSLTLSFSHTLVSGANRLVAVSFGSENSGTIVTGVSYGGQSMTLAISGVTGSSGTRFLCEIWYILEANLPATGSQLVEITLSGSTTGLYNYGFVSEYVGASQGAPEAIAEYNQTSGATITNTMSPSNNAWVISGVGSGNSGSFTHGQSQTEILDATAGGTMTFAVAELRGGNGESSLSSTFSGTVNRLERVAASWAPATKEDNYKIDLEIQFTSVNDFLPIEALCIYTGAFSGTEDILVDFWNGTGWQNLAINLNAHSCNYYNVSLTSTTFTIRFAGGTESNDTTQDSWQVDASLLRLEGAGGKEDAVDSDTSNVDGSADVGTLNGFDSMKTMDGMANLTEDIQSVWRWQEDTSGYSATSSYETYQFWSSWTTNSTTSGNITKIGFYVFANPGNSPQVKLGIYDESGGVPNNLLAQTNAATITGTGWLDLAIIGGALNINASTTYYLSHITNIAPTTQWRYIKTATPTSRYRNNRVWPNLFSPAGTTTAAATNRYGAYRVGYDEYRLDQEVQWTNVQYSMPNEELCIYAGTMAAEDIKVEVWNGSSWVNVIADLNQSSWNNLTITSYLTSADFTMRFTDGTQSSDSNQDTWQIDVALIHIWYEGGENYELNLEVQWTSAEYTLTNEELCIRTGAFSGSESIQVRFWNSTGSSWNWGMNLTADQWNNMSITSYLASSNFTVQFLGGTETGDTTKDSWNIDAALLHVWTDDGTFDYALRVNNTETDSWQVRLTKYSDSNISRLLNCTVYLHNSSDGTSRQIYITDGSYTNQTGPWYGLVGSETIFIAVKVEAVSTGTSYIHTYLEILVPGTTTYLQYRIEFEIT
jgi:hypothetical protein